MCVQASKLSPERVIICSVEAAQVPAWLMKAHVGLAFYQSGFSRVGTCPTKLGEYLAMGLPVVVTKGVGDTEPLVTTRRVGAVLSACCPLAYGLALDALEQLWADPHLSVRCRAVAEECFSLAQGVASYWRVYQRLTGASQEPESHEHGVASMSEEPADGALHVMS